MTARLAFEPIKRTSASEQVMQQIQSLIFDGTYQPGDRLPPERELAAELGVNRTTLREALKRLQAEGLVKISPHSGAEVTDLEPDDLAETLTIRAVLEGYAARTAAMNATPADIQELRDYLHEMRQCVDRGDHYTYGVLNKQFHTKLYSLSPHKRLIKMISDLWLGRERSRSVFELSPDRSSVSYEEHVSLLNAIEARDYDRVERLMREHRANAALALLGDRTSCSESSQPTMKDTFSKPETKDVSPETRKP